jgi:hypothetical protein
MKKTIQVLNSLKESGLIRQYAIAGAFASLFYAEPIVTFDLDLFVLVPDENSLSPLSPIYAHLIELGYESEEEHIIIEGIPVQFLLPYNALTREALLKARKEDYEDVSTCVVGPEYLMAIMLQTGRLKDRQRLALFLEEVEFDQEILKEILSRYSLLEKWELWIQRNIFNM